MTDGKPRVFSVAIGSYPPTRIVARNIEDAARKGASEVFDAEPDAGGCIVTVSGPGVRMVYDAHVGPEDSIVLRAVTAKPA